MTTRTKLIELDDGIFIEVDASEDEVQQVSSKAAEKVSETLDKVKPILVKACRPVMAAWQEINQEMHIEQAEVELGLSFEAEGNIYVTKARGGANLNIKLVLKPKPTP